MTIIYFPKLHLQMKGHPVPSELLSSLWPPEVKLAFSTHLCMTLRFPRHLLEHYKSEYEVKNDPRKKIKGSIMIYKHTPFDME